MSVALQIKVLGVRLGHKEWFCWRCYVIDAWGALLERMQRQWVYVGKGDGSLLGLPTWRRAAVRRCLPGIVDIFWAESTVEVSS